MASWIEVFAAVNGPLPCRYRNVIPAVRISRKPPATTVVNAGAGMFRLTALKLGLPWNASSPAYSNRISVGVSTSNRACPSMTTFDAAAAGGGTGGKSAATTTIARIPDRHERVNEDRDTGHLTGFASESRCEHP